MCLLIDHDMRPRMWSLTKSGAFLALAPLRRSGQNCRKSRERRTSSTTSARARPPPSLAIARVRCELLLDWPHSLTRRAETSEPTPRSCLTNQSGTRAHAHTARAHDHGMSESAMQEQGHIFSGSEDKDTNAGRLTNTFQPRLHTPGWFDPQVWPQHLPSMLQRKVCRHWLHQGTQFRRSSGFGG